MTADRMAGAAPVGLQRLSLLLGLSRDWLRKEALAGRIPCLQAGKRLLFHRTAVERALHERAATATAGAEGGEHA
jgi:hypothetical protein